MGGGDLNLKKSWHPKTQRNQERVWLEERRAAEEKRKVEQLLKEKAADRARSEMLALQEKAGLIKPSGRLEWMYSGSAASSAPQSVEQEAYLLGKRSAQHFLNAKDKADAAAAASGVPALAGAGAAAAPIDSLSALAALGNANANSARDIQSKIREDPLLLIRKREQESLREMMENPLRRQRILERSGMQSAPRQEQRPRGTGRQRSRSRSPAAASMRRSRSPPAENPSGARYRRRSPPPRDARREYGGEHRHSGYGRQGAAHPRSKEADQRALDAMMSNARDIDAMRRDRIKEEDLEREREALAQRQRPRSFAPVLKGPSSSSSSSSSSLGDAVNRRRHYLRHDDDKWTR